jgi:hypothetical protein
VAAATYINCYTYPFNTYHYFHTWPFSTCLHDFQTLASCRLRSLYIFSSFWKLKTYVKWLIGLKARRLIMLYNVGKHILHVTVIVFNINLITRITITSVSLLLSKYLVYNRPIGPSTRCTSNHVLQHGSCGGIFIAYETCIRWIFISYFSPAFQLNMRVLSTNLQLLK